jgi:1A family penicillin-binding protein
LSTERAEPVLDPQLSESSRASRPMLGWLGWLSLAALLTGGAALAGGLVGLAISFRSLPDVRVLKTFKPAEPTRITDIKGQTLAVVQSEANRTVVPLRRISKYLRTAVLAIEDDRFYQHSGIRFDTLVRAALTNFQEGRTVQGGSTVTQQLVKNLFLTPERSLDRKVAEAVLALRLEQVFTKDDILEMYLNQVYWGHGAYGIETAARTYFNKPASDLDLAESTLLAGMLRAPESYSPIRNLKKTLTRQHVVIDRMLELRFITEAEANRARNEKLKITASRSTLRVNKAPYFSTYVVQELVRKYGRDAVLKGGLRVQTTLDLRMQALAESVTQAGIKSLRSRNAGQIALVSMDPRTGYIKAMVGGVDFNKSQYNRASQAQRQPGSTFKPFVYYAAFATGRYSPDSIIDDSPVSFGNYSPKNYDLRFWGPMSIRTALINSRNVPVIRIANRIGMEKVINAARRAGVTSPLPDNLATSIGAGGISPLELTRGYSAFANGGYRVAATAILQVTDQQGNILEQNLPQRERTLKAGPVRMVNSLLQAVVTSGTGTRAELPDGRPVAGKTGTTSDFRDAWFVGYVPQMVTTIWIGNDDFRKPLARSTAGGTYVAPLWRRYMAEALKGQPVLPFPGETLPKDEEGKESTQATEKATSDEEKPRRKKRRRRRAEAVETRPVTTDEFGVPLAPAEAPVRP